MKGNENMENGMITAIVGPMFAEKSGELIITCEKLKKYAKKNVKVYKPINDDRFSETQIVSRLGISLDAENMPTEVTDEVIKKALLDNKETEVVAFDEVHFFSKGIVELVRELSLSGKEVYVAGLNLDYTASTFGPIGDLLAISDKVINKTAFCTVCGGEAKFTQRIINGKPAEFGEQIIVGDTESYEVRCAKHYVHPSKAKAFNEANREKITEIIAKDILKKEEKEG